MRSNKDNTKGKSHKSVSIMMIAVMLTASLWAMPVQAAASMNVFKDANKSVIDSDPLITPHNASTIEQLNTELKILEETLFSLEENAVTGGLTEQEITKIQASKNKLSDLDAEIKKEFAETKKKIKKIGSSKALKRHEEVVAEYTVGMAAIHEQITYLSKTKDRKDIKEKAKNLKEEIQNHTYKPEYKPQSPKLPHRIAEPTKKKPFIGQGIVPAYYSSTVDGVSPFEVTARAAAPTSDDLADTIDANQTQEIKDLAAELDYHPVKIYEYVRNNIDYELYYGSRKGSAETLKQMGGNDFDQASLLIALYRASGIPARYVYGTIDIPIDKAMNWVGVKDNETAGNLLATAGVPTIALISGGEIVALRIEHVWIEAYVPYTNYRGVPISETGKMWIPLDPSFKKYNYKEGLDIPAEMGFDADIFLNDYIATMHNESPIELYVQNIKYYIAVNHPNITFDDVIRTRWIEPEWLGLLPATLPYSTVTVQDEYSEIPDNLRDKIRFYIHDDYGTLLDYTARMPEIAGKRVTISYIAATPEDQAVIDSYGGLYDTPPYLVDLKPVLKVAGNDTATGTSIGMGLTHYFDICFTTWQGTDWIENNIISGNYLAVGLDTQSVPDRFLYPEVTDNETFAGEKLYRTAMDYLDRCDRGQRIADETMQMVTVKEISDVIASNDIRVSYLYGQPQTFEWKGLLVDADRCILGPFSVTGDANESKHYMVLTGMEGSISENRVFEDNYDVEAISGIKALEIASDLGIQIYDINSSNIGAILPTLSLSSAVKADIQNAVNQGWVVKVPATEFAYKNWTGVGWIKMDPDTGEGGYMISGVTSGGQTVDIWPSALMELFTEGKEVDHIEADITYPVPPDIYFAYMKDTINPALYFEVTYTIFYEDGTSATVDEKYIPHHPYPPGKYRFYAGWGTGETRDFVIFGVEITSITPDKKIIPLATGGDTLAVEYIVSPITLTGATIYLDIFDQNGRPSDMNSIDYVYHQQLSETTGGSHSVSWNGKCNQGANSGHYVDPKEDYYTARIVIQKDSEKCFDTEGQILVLPLIDQAYLVTRTGVAIPDDTNKVLGSGTSISLYGVERGHINDIGIMANDYDYYLGNEGSSLPIQVTIGATTYDCEEWRNTKWGSITIDWVEVDPISVAHTSINWNTENSLGWSGWDHSEIFDEGSRWYRVSFTFEGTTVSSPGAENSRRVSLRGNDANPDAAEAASYIRVPYVWGGESYEGGVDCSGLACSVKGIGRTTADGLHDLYLRSNTDNDVNEDMIPDHPEPWIAGINRAQPGDMWYVDSDMNPADPRPVDHVGIYTGSNIIHASWSAAEVVRTSYNPRDNSWWNGGSATTIFRGVGTN